MKGKKLFQKSSGIPAAHSGQSNVGKILRTLREKQKGTSLSKQDMLDKKWDSMSLNEFIQKEIPKNFSNLNGEEDSDVLVAEDEEHWTDTDVEKMSDDSDSDQEFIEFGENEEREDTTINKIDNARTFSDSLLEDDLDEDIISEDSDAHASHTSENEGSIPDDIDFAPHSSSISNDTFGETLNDDGFDDHFSDMEGLSLSEDDEISDDEGENGTINSSLGSHKKAISLDMLDDWEKMMVEENSLRALRKFIQAFRTVCHLQDGDPSDLALNDVDNNLRDRYREQVLKMKGKKSHRQNLRKQKQKRNSNFVSRDNLPYLIADDSEIEKKVWELAFTSIPFAIFRHLDVDNISTPSSSARWEQLFPLVKSYVGNLVHYLSVTSTVNLGSNPTSVVLAQITSSSESKNIFRLIVSFPKVSRQFVKIILLLWQSGEEVGRVHSFLCMRTLCRLDDTLCQDILRSMYLAYVRNCKFVTLQNTPLIRFLRNCIVELYQRHSSYSQSFIFIRQLAIHLRQAIVLKEKDGHKSIYNWQFLQSLQLWAEILGFEAGKNEQNNKLHSQGKGLRDMINSDCDLSLLVYPFVQILQGAISLFFNPSYFAFHLHCIRMLIELGSSRYLILPTLTFLFNMLDYIERATQRPSSDTPPELVYLMRVSSALVDTKSYHDALLSDILELILHYFSSNARSIGFTELALPAIWRLKRFAKKCKNQKFCKIYFQAAQKIEQTMQLIEKCRASSGLCPKNDFECKNFLQEEKDEYFPVCIYYLNYARIARQRREVYEQQNDGYSKEPSKKKKGKKESQKYTASFESEEEHEKEMTMEDDIDVTKVKGRAKKPFKKRENNGKHSNKNTSTRHFNRSASQRDDRDIVENFDIRKF